MMPPDLEAANIAIRLDPQLLPPIGSMVIVRVGIVSMPVRSGWVVDFKVRRTIRRTSWSCTDRPARRWLRFLRVVVAATVYADQATSPKFDFWPEQLSEIVTLPPSCPPIGEWKRITDVLREKGAVL